MRLGETVVNFEGFQGRSLGFWHRLARRKLTEPSLRNISVSQPGVGQRVSWVFVDGLLKVINGPERLLRSPSVPKIAALQIKLIGFGILGVTSCQPLLFFAAQS